jgi:hypothetical protein
MKALAAIFATIMIVTVLAIAALVQLVITLLPYLAVALIVLLVLRARRRSTTSLPSAEAVTVTPASRYRIGAPAAAPEGWVMVPVWVAPTRPGAPVIDAEVIGDRD